VLHKAELMTATPEHEKVSSQIARASGNLVVMTDEHMTDFARYADSIKFDAVEIKSVVDNTIEFKFNKKNKEDITGSFEFTGGIKPFEVIFGRRFTDILTTIGAGLRLSISNNELCYAGFSAEGCRADYLIAPIRQGE
jgi:hypothetical protein